MPEDCDFFDATDENGDGVLEECKCFADCNDNEIQDKCEIADGTVSDCNDNNVPDECEIGFLSDIDDNGLLDECQPDTHFEFERATRGCQVILDWSEDVVLEIVSGIMVDLEAGISIDVEKDAALDSCSSRIQDEIDCYEPCLLPLIEAVYGIANHE